MECPPHTDRPRRREVTSPQAVTTIDARVTEVAGNLAFTRILDSGLQPAKLEGTARGALRPCPRDRAVAGHGVLNGPLEDDTLGLARRVRQIRLEPDVKDRRRALRRVASLRCRLSRR